MVFDGITAISLIVGKNYFFSAWCNLTNLAFVHSITKLNLFEYIAYTEQGENNGTMILDGVCHSAIHFGWVILSRMVELSCSQPFIEEYCLICRVPSSPGVYRRPCVSTSMLHC